MGFLEVTGTVQPSTKKQVFGYTIDENGMLGPVYTLSVEKGQEWARVVDKLYRREDD